MFPQEQASIDAQVNNSAITLSLLEPRKDVVDWHRPYEDLFSLALDATCPTVPIATIIAWIGSSGVTLRAHA